MKLIGPRSMRWARRLLVVAAALPLCQLSACQRVIGTTAAGVANTLPQIVFDAIFSAWLNTILGALGGTGTTGGTGGLGGGGLGGGFGGGGI